MEGRMRDREAPRSTPVSEPGTPNTPKRGDEPRTIDTDREVPRTQPETDQPTRRASGR